MTAEYVLLALLIGTASLPILMVRKGAIRAPSPTIVGLIMVAIAVPFSLVVAAYVHRRPLARDVPSEPRPQQVSSEGYVGSAACYSCHPHEHATWHASYHRTMTQVALPDSLMAPIDGELTQLEGVTFRLRRENQQIWADMANGPANEFGRYSSPVSRRIVMTTGSHHMQLLWYPHQNDSRLLGMFPFVYLKNDQRWIPRGAAFLQPSYSMEDELARWNQVCIACHATNGRTLPGRAQDPTTGEQVYDLAAAKSEVAEFGIACEACHGPGQAHVRENGNPIRRYQQHWASGDASSIVNPNKLPHQAKSQVCGQCHSVQGIVLTEKWWNDGFSYRPGDDLNDSPERFVFQVSQQQRADHQQFMAAHADFVPNHFWPDGMVRISGREYNGLIESPCYQRGELSCLSCHEMHQDVNDDRTTSAWANDQLAPLHETNDACLQCHAEYGDDGRLAEHTHHDPDSTGSLCYNCHMPYTTYGLLKAIRSHQIDSPNVQNAKQSGRPTACNQCHLDQTLGWTAEHLADWYGHAIPELTRDELSIADSVIWSLRGDAGLRALAAWSFGWSAARNASSTDWIPPYLIQLLNDPYAAVRYISEKSLRVDSAFAQIQYDFLIPAGHRRPYLTAPLSVWNRRPHRPNPAVLIDDDQRLMTDTFRRLLDARDNRIVVLVE